jgi:hypothetical protein
MIKVNAAVSPVRIDAITLPLQFYFVFTLIEPQSNVSADIHHVDGVRGCAHGVDTLTGRLPDRPPASTSNNQ